MLRLQPPTKTDALLDRPHRYKGRQTPQRVDPQHLAGMGGADAGWASVMHLVTSQRAERSLGTVSARKKQKRDKQRDFSGMADPGSVKKCCWRKFCTMADL